MILASLFIRKTHKETMDTDDLRIFVVVAEEGATNRAAERLRLSQPTISRALARLESDLGHRLFDRPGRRLALNDAGRLALERAARILDDEESLRSSLDDLARRARTLRVGSVAPAPLWRLTALLVERFPGQLLTSQFLQGDEVETRLLRGEIDLGLGLAPAIRPGLRSIPFMEENLAVALPEGHPLSGRSAVAREDLDGETFLLFGGIGFWRAAAARMLPHSRFIVQEDRAVFETLMTSSPLPFFTTDAPSLSVPIDGRSIIPIDDDSAHAFFHLLVADAGAGEAHRIFERLAREGGASPARGRRKCHSRGEHERGAAPGKTGER